MPSPRFGRPPYFSSRHSPFFPAFPKLSQSHGVVYHCSMPLLERHSLLAELRNWLADAVAGSGAVVCLLGEAGVGKTALLREFVAEADVRVLWSSCEDFATPDALGPLRDWAREAGWDLAEIADEESGKLAIFSGVLSALGEDCTLAVIEDLHWADDATLDLVKYLGRRIASERLLLLVSVRDDNLDAPRRVRHALSRIPADLKASLRVPRLSADAVDRLAREAGRDAAGIFEVTGGNPFFVTEILKDTQTLPSTVRDAVLTRFDRLPEAGRVAVKAVAIFPRRVENWLLRQLCPQDDGKGVDEAVTAGMLVMDTDGYSFRHEIARRVIEDSMPAERRVQLNRAALDLLRKAPGTTLARLVHHADVAADATAISTFAPRAAAEASRVGAHREAARHYLTALKYAITFEVEKRAALYEDCSFELHLVGRMQQAIESRSSSVELRRLLGQRIAEGDGLRWLSRFHYFNGNRVEAERYAEEALSVLEKEPAGPELAMAHSNLAQLAALEDDAPLALERGNSAVVIARQLGRPDILAHALNNMGTAQRWTDPPAARHNLARSLQLALENDLHEHAARAYTNAAFVEMGWRENSRAHGLFDRGLAYCEARDLQSWHSYMSGCRAELLLREGKWNEAAGIALEVIADDGVPKLSKFPAMAALARIRVRRGDPDAVDLLAEMKGFLENGMEAPRFLSYAVVAAERAWLAAGRNTVDGELVAKAHALAARTGDPWVLGEIVFWGNKLGVAGLDATNEARPHQLLESGRWAEAETAWRDLRAPYEQALALLHGNENAQRCGLAKLEDMGARSAADRFRGEMRKAGVRRIPRGPHAATRANHFGLTRRQMEVLRLIDRGLSNVQIGERLFVSAKTVDHHVSAILAKFEARTRGEAAARARATGLIGDSPDLSAIDRSEA